MCVRIAVDMDIFTTLSERNGPVSLEELAAVKKASPILTGNASNPSPINILVVLLSWHGQS